MGLQGQLSDVSSDSLPLLLLCLIATGFNHLRSSVSAIFHYLGLPRLHDSTDPVHDAAVLTSIGSGLADLIVLTQQLNLNRLLSDRFHAVAGSAQDSHRCVICLSNFKDGDHVRKLTCRHVFHSTCFDGWLDHRNFSCPLCRSPLIPDGTVECAGRRVGADLVEWFSRSS